MTYSTLLEEALEAWAYTRRGVIDEFRNLPASSLDRRPSPESRTASELARHLIEMSLMIGGELSRPDGDFTRKPFPRLIREYAKGISRRPSRAAILTLLQTTHARADRQIRRAGELHMLQYITRFDGQPGTRLAWMHHAIAHEEYHRGQLALYARLAGRTPALTKKILGG